MNQRYGWVKKLTKLELNTLQKMISIDKFFSEIDKSIFELSNALIFLQASLVLR